MEERDVSLLEMLKSLWNSLMLPEYSGLHNPPQPSDFPALQRLRSFPSIPAGLGAAFQDVPVSRGQPGTPCARGLGAGVAATLPF